MAASDKSQATLSVQHSLLAGGFAGLVSRLFVHPADTIKARLQVQGSLPGGHVYHNTLDAVQQVFRKEGPRGFYSGFGVVLVGALPANMAYFGGYELGKLVLPGQPGFARDAAVGAMAQLLAGVVFTPVDVVKERMQVQALPGTMYGYRGPFHALKSLVQQDGFYGLFRGYWATNCVWIPWNILHIAMYERLKQGMVAALELRDAEQLPSWAVGSSSACSAGVAAVMTHPADVVKTRVQVLSGGGSRLSMAAVAQRILAEEGVQGFMSGVGARVLSIAPGCAISWAVYEAIKQHLLDQQ